MSSLTPSHRLRATYSPSDCQARILDFLINCGQPVEFREIRDVRCMPLASVEEVLAGLENLERAGHVCRQVEPRKMRDGRQRMVTMYTLAKGGAS